MTSPLVNIFVAPGLYLAPEDVAGSPPGIERCGGPDRYCYLAPANLTGICGTWLGLPDHCCWVATENDYSACGGISGIRDTPFNRFGSSDAFNSTGSTCPSGNFKFFDYEEAGGTIAACCPNGQTGQAFFITGASDNTQYILDGIRCGTFEVPGGVQDPMTEPVPTSTSGNGGSISTSGNGGSTTSRGGLTSSPPTTAAPTGAGTTSSTGGPVTTTSGSTADRVSIMSYLVVGSFIFGLFFGGNL
ncbi:hypothetical protein TWF106_002295 [Orbilia oligospora]|uniref:Uncharacterized protein n=1 Tax=Orbilia oligospora TaxID=2813651 RepID=A0A7C8UCM6_ORBOL|nr:hypothetical protein TWF788_004877 [Orbilia oligospora]KAF3202768.1 hypothetical protein TWF106_002295 [Orbilia oligospora]